MTDEQQHEPPIETPSEQQPTKSRSFSSRWYFPDMWLPKCIAAPREGRETIVRSLWQ